MSPASWILYGTVSIGSAIGALPLAALAVSRRKLGAKKIASVVDALRVTTETIREELESGTGAAT